MKNSEVTLYPIGDTNRYAVVFKANKNWGYALADADTQYRLSSLPYLHGSCIGMSTKTQARDAAMYHAAQNIIIPENKTSLDKALTVCPKDERDALIDLWQWQNRYKVWERLGYNNNDSHRKACDKEYPLGLLDYSPAFHGECVEV